MPWHVAIDQASERRLGKLQIGTTRRGIGPGLRRQGLAARHPRPGPARPEDPAPEDRGRARREERLARARLRASSRSSSRRSPTRLEGYAQRLRPYVADTSLLVDRALRDGKEVLFEGAQGTLLDLDHGTYPFVTSSNPVAGGAATGIGIGPTRIDAVHRRREGVRDARRRGAVPDRDRGARPGARARARRRVRHGHRPRAPLRLARPRRAPLRRAPERDHVARADEARRALGVRRAAGLRRATGCATARRRASSRRTRATSTTPSRCTRCCPAGSEPLDGVDAPTSCPTRRARYVEFVERELEVAVCAGRHRRRARARALAALAVAPSLRQTSVDAAHELRDRAQAARACECHPARRSATCRSSAARDPSARRPRRRPRSPVGRPRRRGEVLRHARRARRPPSATGSARS